METVDVSDPGTNEYQHSGASDATESETEPDPEELEIAGSNTSRRTAESKVVKQRRNCHTSTMRISGDSAQQAADSAPRTTAANACHGPGQPVGLYWPVGWARPGLGPPKPTGLKVAHEAHPRLLASVPAPDDSEISEDNIPANTGPFLEGIQSRNIDIDSDINISQGCSLVAERTTGHDFLQAKPKVRKSHIYVKANGETIMVDGKPRWQCNRCTDRQAPTTFAASSTRNAIDHLRRCHQIGPLGPVAVGLTTTQFSIQSAFYANSLDYSC
ncbi:hypothetical protein HOY82DRAFT_611295 [Tuber indicum]|nr:hypothetical protein HOY82DRAFT_611295 [Tuber indicum]